MFRPKGPFLLTILALVLLLNAQNDNLYSVGKLTILKHSETSALNKTVTLNTLSYYEHLPNLEMLKIRVLKANPFDACSPLNVSQIFQKKDPLVSQTFILVDGEAGSCNYWQKAQNVREALARGIIIINDEPQKNGNRPADFTDDGLFLSFLINTKDAALIMPLTTNEFQGQLSIQYTTKPADKKVVYLWLSSLNPQSYDYLKWWNETMFNLPELDSKVDWEPKYVFYGHAGDEKKHVYSCICSGLFCSPEYHGKTSDALVKEDLRQKLIFKENKTKYLQYIRLFTEKCLENYLEERYAEECSKTQMVNLELNFSDINRRIEILEDKCNNDKELFGELLTDKGRFSMINSYPVILLNREMLQVHSQADLQAAMCRRLSLEESEGCIQNVRTTTNEIVISVAFLVLTLVGLFAVGFFIVMCYKNKLRKEMHKEVKMQVSTAVEHYFQLSEETSKNG